MTDGNGSWERNLITKLAADALVEQRRRRRWGIFFKLLTFAYVTFLLIVLVDWSSRTELTGGKKHTAMVELTGIIAPGTDASAERITTALQAAFKDKNKDYIKILMKDIHDQFIGVVREGRGKRLKETPDMFSGLIWTGAKSVELGLADGFGSLDSVARDVIKAEDIVDYSQKEGFAEKVAKRFGASVASSLAEFARRNYFTAPLR